MLFDVLELGAADARMLSRPIRHQVHPQECNDKCDGCDAIVNRDPSVVNHDNAAQLEGDDRSKVAAEQSGNEFAFLVRWRPFSDNIMQCWKENTLQRRPQHI